MQPPFQQTGGLYWTIAPGVVANATWPFAQISVAPDRVDVSVSVLGLYRRGFSFTQQTLETARRRWFVISTGMQLVHSIPGYPSSIIFWTFGYRSLAAALRIHGYHVEDNSRT